MTERPLDPLDELASAHIDGLSSEAEDGRVATDPSLQARVARLSGVRDAIRLSDGPIDHGRRELAISAALAAAGRPAPAPSHDPHGRRPNRARRAQVLAVVAAAVLAALLVPRLVDDDRPDIVVAAPGTAGSSADDGASTFSAPSAERSAGSALTAEAAPVGPVELGPVTDLDDLARRLAVTLDAPADPTTSSPASAPGPDFAEQDNCIAAARGRIESDGDTVLLVGFATLQGDRVVAVVSMDADGARQMDAAVLPGCSSLGSRPV